MAEANATAPYAWGAAHEVAPRTTAGEIGCDSAAFARLCADLLRAGVAVRFRARGMSMSPLVRDGDLLLVRPVAADDPRADKVRVGDVVLCVMPTERVLAHRVVARLKGPDGVRYRVQGDQVASPDGAIPATQIYGRVTAIERAGEVIVLDRPVVRWLGLLAVLRSRARFGRGWGLGRANWLARRLPPFRKYLAWEESIDS